MTPVSKEAAAAGWPSAKARKTNDNYPTAPALARLICTALARTMQPTRVLEPSCGAGNFLAAARQCWPVADLQGLELDPLLAEQAHAAGFPVRTGDALVDNSSLGRFDLVIGNPPYSMAERFVHHFRDQLTDDGRLVYLLRLNFLGGQKRYKTLWNGWPPARIHCLPKRPGFTTDGGTDMTEYAVFEWTKAPPSDGTRLVFLDNREGVSGARGR